MNKIIFGVFLSLLASTSTYGMEFGKGCDDGQSSGSSSNEKQVQSLDIDSTEFRKRKSNSELEEEWETHKKERGKLVEGVNGSIYPYLRLVPQVNQQMSNEVTEEESNEVTEEESNEVTEEVKWENPFENDMFSELKIQPLKVVWDKSFYKFKEGVDAQQVVAKYIEFVNKKLKKAARKEAVKRIKKWFYHFGEFLEPYIGKSRAEKEKEKWDDIFNSNMFSEINQNYINIFRKVWDKSCCKVRKGIYIPQVVVDYIEFVNDNLKKTLREVVKRKIAIWLVSLDDLLVVDPDKFEKQPEIFGLIGSNVKEARWYPCFYYNEKISGPVLDNFIYEKMSDYILKDLNKEKSETKIIEYYNSVQKGKGYRFVGFEFEKENREYTGVLSKDSFNKIKEKYLNKFSSNASHWLQALIRPCELKELKRCDKCDDITIEKKYFTDFIKELIKPKKGMTYIDILERISDDEKNNF